MLEYEVGEVSVEREEMDGLKVREKRSEPVGDSLGWHYDAGSVVTQLVLLSDPSEYEGGELEHESNDHVGTTPLRRGDVAVYRSLTYHRVRPLRSGRRRALAVEWFHQAGAVDHTGRHRFSRWEPVLSPCYQ